MATSDRSGNQSDRTWVEGQLSSIGEVLRRTWYLGFTSFGGPVVHFQIFRRQFVEGKDPWLDEQTYMELFAICQSLPGPGSTKFGFCMTMMRAGIIGAVIEFLVWSLPGAVAIFLLSIGISRIPSNLPEPVYALLSGLNAAAVGIIALAGVQLARKAITDKLTLILVLFTACAGMCYNALWYFPTLMALCGAVCCIWELWGKDQAMLAKKWWIRRRRTKEEDHAGNDEERGVEGIQMEEVISPSPAAPVGRDGESVASRRTGRGGTEQTPAATSPASPTADIEEFREAKEQSHDGRSISPDENLKRAINANAKTLSPATGILLICGFFASFIAIMVLNATLKRPPLELQLFRNMYLAGTIIFGGGPVVIPLLREYVVQPGWVSQRDFLIGLAITQAFPGPNFNFAVYLGALAIRAPVAAHSTHSPVLGALLGFLGIFTPGLVLATGFQSLWHHLRTRRSVVQILRGVNAGAVGLVFSAVYRLWEAGYLKGDQISNVEAGAVQGKAFGVSLGLEPWWVVVATVAYSLEEWFGVETWIAILVGAAMGVAWWGVVRH